jgi:hypothetical protein
VAVDFLSSPTPNPFRGRAMLRFGLAREGDVQLELFDVTGRNVRTLAAGKHAAGEHTLTWDGRDRQGHEVRPGSTSSGCALPPARSTRGSSR